MWIIWLSAGMATLVASSWTVPIAIKIAGMIGLTFLQLYVYDFGVIYMSRK